jgi:hypothetical protein
LIGTAPSMQGRRTASSISSGHPSGQGTVWVALSLGGVPGAALLVDGPGRGVGLVGDERLSCVERSERNCLLGFALALWAASKTRAACRASLRGRSYSLATTVS